MKFNGIDNQTVELKIHNYQYPDSTDRDYDGNWLLIFLIVSSKLGKWKTIDPSLLTWEVRELILWFRCLADNKEPYSKNQEFIEPNISFYLLSDINADTKNIKIKFDLESRPQSAKDEIEYSVIFSADKNELNRIARDLEKELQKYPERV